MSRRATASRERISLRAVAELAGVSVATVSRVMSDSSHPVAPETRRRVLEAAEGLGFRPNQLARALVTARSQTVGVIVHDISDPYFGELVKGLEDGIRSEGYRLFVASSDRDPERELEYVRAFEAYRADGIVFAASGLTDPSFQRSLENVVARFRAGGGLTIVLSEHFLAGPKVDFDNEAATADMVRYLVERGHDHIGFIRGPAELAVSDRRFNAYREALGRFGLTWKPESTAMGSFTVDGGRQAAAQILSAGPPTAILAANDLMAIGASRHVLDAGLRVPDDISIAGFDDMPLAEFAPVPLTTVRVPTYDIGQQGARLLLRALAGDDASDVRLQGQIVERASVAGRGSFSA